MRTLQASTSYSVGFGISSLATFPQPSTRRSLTVAKMEPSEKSVEIMRKFSEQYARRSGTYFCSDKGVTSVVIKGSNLGQGPLVSMKAVNFVFCCCYNFVSAEGEVVKRSSASQGSSFGQQTLSRGKRSLGDTYRTHAEDPSLSLRKRRRQREMLLEIEERKKEQHKRMTGSVQSAKESHGRLVTSSQPLSGASELLQMEAIRSSYASQTAGGVRPRPPNRLAKDSKEVSSSRNITAVQHIPSVRLAEASRTVRMLGNDLLDPSQLKGLTSMTMRSALAARNRLSGLPSANGRMLQSSYPDQPPMTVASLLNSLGLGKYAVLFQAEEVDMAALKQMGDGDLKELGIPMGPRKKILLAMLRTKRPV